MKSSDVTCTKRLSLNSWKYSVHDSPPAKAACKQAVVSAIGRQDAQYVLANAPTQYLLGQLQTTYMYPRIATGSALRRLTNRETDLDEVTFLLLSSDGAFVQTAGNKAHLAKKNEIASKKEPACCFGLCGFQP